MKRLTVVIGIVLGCGVAVFAQPIITNQPTSITNVAGTTATFSVGVTGIPPLAFQWWYSGNGLTYPRVSDTNASLTLSNVQAYSAAGSYWAVVTNLQGSVTSAVATLIVRTPPRIGIQPANQTASLFADARFSVVAAGDEPLNYQWRLNGADLPATTNSMLTITNIQLSDSGGYDVVVTNSYGSVTSQVATLTIVPFSSIYCFGYSWTDTQAVAHRCAGPTACLSCYWQGRISNGPMWPEFLSTNFGLVYLPSHNYAVCGAGAADILNQARNYLAPAKPQLSLYCFMLTDDIPLGYFDVTNQTKWDQIIKTGVLQNSNAVANLYAKGARTILAQGELDFSKSPFEVSAFGGDTNLLSKLREDLAKSNAGFSNSVLAIGRSRPDLRIIWMDLFSKFDEVRMNPAQYGFTIATIAALDDPSLPDKSFTGPGSDYVYWDSLHPTTKLHELLTAWNLEALTNSVLETLDVQLEGSSSTLQMNHLQIGRDYTLQKSGDLSNWTDLHSFTASAGTNVWTQTQNGAVAGFYRLKWER
jgi:phospholipase/lecithinase/hemolysin